jgi:hypothetical protein
MVNAAVDGAPAGSLTQSWLVNLFEHAVDEPDGVAHDVWVVAV